MYIIKYLIEVFNIDTPIIMSSDLNCIKRENKDQAPVHITGEPQSEEARYIKELRATQRIIDMCREVGGDTYISGSGGNDYLIDRLFREQGMGITYQSFRHPVYRQCYSPFILNLSALDYILNVDTSRTGWVENIATENPIIAQ